VSVLDVCSDMLKHGMGIRNGEIWQLEIHCPSSYTPIGTLASSNMKCFKKPSWTPRRKRACPNDGIKKRAQQVTVTAILFLYVTFEVL
jgi:hypothetical protein